MSFPAHPRRKRIVVATALAGLASIGAWAAISSGVFNGTQAANSGTNAAASTAVAAAVGKSSAGTGLAQADDRPRTHIIVFRDAPLATYQGGVAGIAKPARKGNGRGRIDAKPGVAAANATGVYRGEMPRGCRGDCPRFEQL